MHKLASIASASTFTVTGVVALLFLFGSCAAATLSSNPPGRSEANLTEMRLPSLTITGMTQVNEDGRDVICGKMEVRAYESTTVAAGYPKVPQGPVLQTMNVAFATRGQSSQAFPKKSLSLELRDQADPLRGKSQPLLGLPGENDFVLHSLFSDKSMMRNLIAYRLGGEIMDWSPRTRLVELWGSQPDGALNNTIYQGIYLLCEKIKIDDNRVAVTPLTIFDNTEPAVTGGYLLRIDWDSNSDWHPTTGTGNLEVVEPNKTTITEAQQNYVESFFHDLETSLASTPVGNWREYLDQRSFIDFMLLNELLLNVDGYRLSTYLYKERNGKLKAGPPWDFDLGSGNDGRSVDTDRWEILRQIDPTFLQNDGPAPASWWCEMLHDQAFRTALRQRWKALRSSSFSNSHLKSLINDAVDELRPAVNRNFARWPSLTSHDDTWWTPMPIPGSSADSSSYTYDDHLDWFERWLNARVAWMDSDASWKVLDDWAASSALHLVYD